MPTPAEIEAAKARILADFGRADSRPSSLGVLLDKMANSGRALIVDHGRVLVAPGDTHAQ